VTQTDNERDPSFRRITPQRVAERVADEISRLIATGRLIPGQRLPGERDLALRMGVSRVSIRAALQQLKAQGLVSAVQGGGTRIKSSVVELDRPLTELLRLNRENLHDLAEIRAILEVWAARRAAQRATPEDLDQLDRLLAAMDDTERAEKYKAEDDVRFHMGVARASHSAVYLHLLSVIRDILTPMLEYHRYELFSTAADDRAVNAQHRAVVNAISRGSPEAAAEAMHAHLDWVLSRYDDARRQNPETGPERSPERAG
jgi:GntR family transcriptional regulator, transcriptional repressor for pyruvate dehydrogenase complex